MGGVTEGSPRVQHVLVYLEVPEDAHESSSLWGFLFVLSGEAGEADFP